MRAVIGALALVLLLGCDDRPRPTAPPKAPPKPTAPMPAGTPSSATNGPQVAAGIRYLVQTTAGAAPDAELPLIVAIHGYGDRPENFKSIVRKLPSQARVVIPYGLTPYGRGYSWFDLRPRDQMHVGIDAAAKRLAVMLVELAARYPTRGKPVVTGFSQGGMLSFALATQHPTAISAAFPLSGYIPPELITDPPSGAPPIVALHGEADTRLRLEPTRAGVDELKKLGWDVTLHTYPDVPHSLSPAMLSRLFIEIGRATHAPD